MVNYFRSALIRKQGYVLLSDLKDYYGVSHKCITNYYELGILPATKHQQTGCIIVTKEQYQDIITRFPTWESLQKYREEHHPSLNGFLLRQEAVKYFKTIKDLAEYYGKTRAMTTAMVYDGVIPMEKVKGTYAMTNEEYEKFIKEYPTWEDLKKKRNSKT